MQNILKGRKLTASRGGTLVLGVIAAVVAAVLLVLYLRNYRNSVKSDVAPAPVLVAKALIPKGTPGSVVAEKRLFTRPSVPKEQLKVGAITDPAFLAGRVAATDIFPDSQLTAADFTVATASTVQTKISGAQRAIALPVSGPQGLVGTVTDGNKVDIYVQVGQLLTLVEQDVLVLRAPVSTGGGIANVNSQSSGMILRVNSKQAAELAFASGNGTLWFVLRPTVGASKTPPQTITLQTLLAGKKG